MEYVYLNSINAFLACKKIAIAGVSSDTKKFANIIFKELENKGYELYPINPKLDEYQGKMCYKTISSLPDGVEAVVLVTPKKIAEELVGKISQKGIKQLWIQPGAETVEAIALAKSLNMNVIHHQCILMFGNPMPFYHKIHKGINQLFGKYPK